MEFSPENNIKKVRPVYSPEELGVSFGEHEILTIPVDKLVILPQIRGNKSNPSQVQLTESIRSNELVNPVDIALMTSNQLESHLEFINNVWGTEAKLGDYGEPNNGLYPVLIAGHSRVLSLKTIQAEDVRNVSAACKIHEISSSAEFLSLQLAENIYSGVNPERRAIAIVEMYHFGFDSAADPEDALHWSSYADFIRKNPGHLSKEMLTDGMAFASLPDRARDFVFSGKIYYAVGVELGKNSKTVNDYVRFRIGSEATEEDINEAYVYELSLMLGHLTNSKQNSKAGVKKMIDYINGNVKHMKSLMNQDNSDSVNQIMMDMIANAPNIQRDEYLGHLKKQHKAFVDQIKRHPATLAIELLSLDAALTHEDHNNDIIEIEEAYMKNIGGQVLKSLSEL